MTEKQGGLRALYPGLLDADETQKDSMMSKRSIPAEWAGVGS